MHTINIGFDRLTVYLLSTIAEMQQVSFAELLRVAAQDYIKFRPSLRDMVPPHHFYKVRQQTYRASSSGQPSRYPCDKNGRFSEEEWSSLEEVSGKPVSSSLMRQIATWWLNLPQNRELVAQLMERFEQQPAR